MESSVVEMAQNKDRDVILLETLFESYKSNPETLEDLLEQIVNMLKKNKKKIDISEKKTIKKQTEPNIFNVIDVKISSDKIYLILNKETREALELDIENGDLEKYEKMIDDNSFDKVLLGINIKKVVM